MKDCYYCDELKERLQKLDLNFEDRDIDDVEHEDYFKKICEKTKTESVPVVIIGKQILVPNISFKTIEEASLIIQKLR